MGVTSARVADLAEFVARGDKLRGELEGLRASAELLSGQVRGDSPGLGPTPSRLRSCAGLLGALFHNERFVATVHDALVAADRHDGQPVVDDRVVVAALRGQGLLDRPAAVQVEEMAVHGVPPTSGFVDDPVCGANGNFVHGDVDLAFPGFASCLDVVRMYNSLGHRVRGAFGPGWSSVLDTRVAAVADAAPVVFLPDGAAVTFPAREDGTYAPDVRRGLVLRSDGDGWELRGPDEAAWRFDARGELVGLARGAASVTVDRAGDEVHLTEELSGRRLTYRLVSGRVVAARSGDGQECGYSYDSDGHLVAVHRPGGDLTYVVESGLVVSVVDADGVPLCHNAYDADGRVLRQTSPHGRTSVYEYDEVGTTRVSDTEDGPVNVLVHDRAGNLTSLIDGHGNDMRLRYDAEGRVVRRVDRTGRATRYEYTDAGLLARRVDPDGASHTWVWDDSGRLVRDTDRAGGTTSYSYTGDTRVPSRVVGPDGGVVATRVDDRGLPAEVTDADGVPTRFEWTRDGLLAGVVDALGHRHEFDYDARGLLVAARNPAGVAARFALDESGRVVESATADGVQRFIYSPAGRLLRCEESDGGVWTFDHGSSGEVERLTDATGAVLRLERDTHGDITAFVAPDGAVYRQEYDDVGRLVAVVDPAGSTTRLEYDAEGRSVAVTDAAGRQWRREVDWLGRTVRITAPDGSTSSRSYHPNGELAATTDPAGRTWGHDVDAAGRLLVTVDPAGAEERFEWSPAGRPLRTRSAQGRASEHRYDAAGRLVGLRDRGRESSYELRPDGQVRLWREGGAEFTLDYDAMGRLTSLRGPGVDLVQQWAHGRVVGVGASASPATFAWDRRGRLAAATDPAGVTTEFTHDPRGRLVEEVTGASSTRARFDEVGYVRQVFDSLGHATRLSTDPTGRTNGVETADGRSLRYEHTALGLAAAVSTSEGEVLAQFRYDPAGLLREAVGAAGSTRLERDAVGRVSAVEGPGYGVRYQRDLDGLVVALEDESGFAVGLDRSERGDVEAFRLPGGEVVAVPARDVVRDGGGRVVRDEQGREYGYDAAGRLVRSATAAGRATTYEYGPAGLLAAERDERGEHRYSYDAGGRLVARRGRGVDVAYAYDAAGRRTGETHADGTDVAYEWDALDRLVRVVRRRADGSTDVRSLTWDAFGCPVLVDGVPVAWDVARSGKAVRVGETRYLRDGLAVRAVGADAWADALPDDPWGDDGATGVRLGYRGEVAVDGLVLIGARVYDPASRCFLSPDPADPVPGALAFAGPYAYAGNDPVNLVDPTGLRPISEADYAELARRADRNLAERVWDAAKEDPWGTIALVVFAAPIAAAVGVGAAAVGTVGGGILLGSGISAGIGLLTDTFDPRKVALDGVLGGIIPGGSVLKHAAVGAVSGGAYSVIDQVVVQGKGIGEVDLAAVALSSAFGGLTLGGAKLLGNQVPRFQRAAGAGGRYLDDAAGGLRGALGAGRAAAGRLTGAALGGLRSGLGAAQQGAARAVGGARSALGGLADRLPGLPSLPGGLPPVPWRSVLLGRYGQDFAAAVRQADTWNWSAIGHGILDVAGLVPVIGEPADGINAVWYAAEGDYVNAGLSAAGMIPIAGWGATGAKALGKGADAAKGADEAAGVADDVGDGTRTLDPRVGQPATGGSGGGARSGGGTRTGGADPGDDGMGPSGGAGEAAGRSSSGSPAFQARLQQVREKLPEEWGPGEPNKKKAGLRWRDGDGNGLRVDEGDPGSPWPSQRVDHVVLHVDGRIVDASGTPIADPKPSKTQAAHIPLDEWLTWSHWSHP